MKVSKYKIQTMTQNDFMMFYTHFGKLNWSKLKLKRTEAVLPKKKEEKSNVEKVSSSTQLTAPIHGTNGTILEKVDKSRKLFHFFPFSETKTI